MPRLRPRYPVLVAACCLLALPPAGAQETTPETPPAPATEPAPLCPCPPPEPPPPPPPRWSASLGAGISLTRGNADSQSTSLSLAAKRDAGGRHVVKIDALYLRGESDGELTVDKTSAILRDDVRLQGRLSAFGDLRYARDRFQQLDLSLAATLGLAWAVVATDRVELSVDLGAGGIREEFADGHSSSAGTARLGEAFTAKLSPSSTLTHAAAATFKLDDSDDYLVHAELALATAITPRSELKVTLVDDYRNVPARPELRKNDLSMIAAVVFSF